MITKISEFKKIHENAGISITNSDNVHFTEYLRKHWENWNGYPHAFAALKDELDELGKSKNIKFVVDNNFDMKSIDVSADKMMESDDVKSLLDKLRAFGFMPGSEPEMYLMPQVGVSRDKPLEYTLIRMY